MAKYRNIVINSPHFELQELAQGVFAAIHKDGGGAIGNAGIIDLGDRALVFDTFISPLAAEDLRTAAKELIGKPIKHVINSHYHNDHIRGNQVFAEADLIASQESLQLIQTEGMQELKWDQENAEREFEAHTMMKVKAKDEIARQRHAFFADYFRVIVESLPLLNICLPKSTFTDSRTFEGPLRNVKLKTFVGGHTGDDSILILPEDGIAFLADLLFVGCHPFLANGNPEKWLRILAKIGDLDLEVFVPGHGPVGGLKDLVLLGDHIRALMEIANEIVSSDMSGEMAKPGELPAPFDTWNLPVFFQSNIEFLCKRLADVEPASDG